MNGDYNIHHTSFAFPATASGTTPNSDVTSILSKTEPFDVRVWEKILQKR